MKRVILIICLGLIISCKKEKTTDAIMPTSQGYMNIANEKAKQLCMEGMAESDMRNFSEAKTLLEKSNQIEKNNVIIMNALANTVNILGEIEKAENLYKKALEIDNNFIPLYVNYGNFLNEQKRFDESEKILFEGLKKEPIKRYKVGLYFNLSLIMKKQSKCLEAEQYAELALENCDPNDIHRKDITDFINAIKARCIEKNSH
jgi:type IV pilus assembly protein PilF